MKKQKLNLEIENLMEVVNKKFPKKSVQYEEMEYILTTLHEYYIKKLNDGIARELIIEFENLSIKLSGDIAELKTYNFSIYFPLVSQMLQHLDKVIEK